MQAIGWDVQPRPWKKLLQRSVAVLGEAMSCCLHDPQTQQFFGYEFQTGSVLCASPNEREMFILRPLGEAANRAKVGDNAIHALDLHQRFMGREADGYYNLSVPNFRRPKFCGELVILRYLSDKDIDDESKGEVVWEHYFEKPGQQPEYAELWDCSLGQFYIPPGPWRVSSAGIEYAPKE